MQRDLRSIVEPDRNHRRSNPDGRVADQSLVSPKPRAKGAREISFKQNWNAARQTYLSAVRMTAQHEVKSGVGCLTIDLRRMGEKDRNTLLRNIRRRPLDIVRAVKMGVVHPGEVNRIRASPDGDALVKEEIDAQSFKIRDHGN